jgi:hypothetical protein
MHAVDLSTVEMIDIESALDPTRRLRVAFPISSATGTAASASVYFELEPGDHVGGHTEGLVGDEVARAHAGQIVVVPAMMRHDMTNAGQGILRVLGTFASSTVVSTFEEPIAPDGPQVLVIGASKPIVLPLATAVL